MQNACETTSKDYIGLFHKKSTHTPMDEILEILVGGGLNNSGNPGRRGPRVELKKTEISIGVTFDQHLR